MRQPAQFEEYMQARWPALVRAAFMLGCKAGEAEDVAQAALLQVWRNWDRVDRADSPDAYVYTVLLNTARKAMRKRARFWASEPTWASRISGPEHEDLRLDVRAAINALPFEQRVVIILRYLEDRPESEVAQILGIPVGTVKSRASRALDALGRQKTAHNRVAIAGIRERNDRNE